MQETRLTSCDRSVASKALRSTTVTMNVMMMRPKTLLRFSRPCLVIGERFGEFELVTGLFMLRPCGRSPHSPCCGESASVLDSETG